MVELAGRPLIQYPLSAVREAGLEPLVIAKRDTDLPRLEVPIHREEPADPHPLHGVIAALEAAHGRPVIVVACDMPLVAPPLIAWLASIVGNAAPQFGGTSHPMLARYEGSALPALTLAVREGRSASAAMRGQRQRLIDEAELAVFGNPRHLLFNVNDARDLKRAAALLAISPPPRQAGEDPRASAR
jgi:molybdopterin-guanine dinucleotide biosynthesis protein A